MKKIVSLATALFISATLSVSAFAADIPASTQQIIENNITADTSSDLTASTKALSEDSILKADAKSFKGKFSNLFTELNKLRVECKDLWSSIKATNQSIKTEWKSLKDSLKSKDKEEAKKILTDLKAKVEPLRTQVKALHSDITVLRAQKTTEWTNFRAAVKARDEVKASTALNNIISLKKQIIEKQKLVLDLKQQILGLF